MKQRGIRNGGKARAGFTLLELIVAATLMAGLLVLIFQVVSAVLNPWAQETDRASAAVQAQTTLDFLAADLQSAAPVGTESVLAIPADPRAGEPLLVLRRDPRGDLSVAAYWLGTWETGGDRHAALFSASLSAEETWDALRSGEPDALERLGLEHFAPAGAETLLAVGVVDFAVAAFVYGAGGPRRLEPAFDDGVLRFPSRADAADGWSGMPLFLEVRLRVLSNAGMVRLSALRAGSGEFPETTEAEVRDRFGVWFTRRIRMPSGG